MKKNVLILTTGSSGSSVLAGLLASKGFWVGHETKKLKFDTYENSRLVDLNMAILRASGFRRRDCNDIPPPDRSKIEQSALEVELRPYTSFLEECRQYEPWLWKDPRLAYTGHFWQGITDFKNCLALIISRQHRQSYSGLLLDRDVPMSSRQLKEINDNYIKNITIFLKKTGLPFWELQFEELIVSPESSCDRMSDFLGIDISIDDLKKVYKGRLYKTRYRFWSFHMAHIKYLMHRLILRDHVRFPRLDDA